MSGRGEFFRMETAMKNSWTPSGYAAHNLPPFLCRHLAATLPVSLAFTETIMSLVELTLPSVL